MRCRVQGAGYKKFHSMDFILTVYRAFIVTIAMPVMILLKDKTVVNVR